MIETNTIIIYRVDKAHIEQTAALLDAEKLVGATHWVQLRFMRRILAEFDTNEHAQAALATIKQRLASLPGCRDAQAGLSLGYNQSMAEPHLPLPDKGTLLFVSPPPSPPNEWVSSIEEEPNQRTHYEAELNAQLERALREFKAGKTHQSAGKINESHVESKGLTKSLDSAFSPASPTSPTLSLSKESFYDQMEARPISTPNSPRTVTIIEAGALSPALNVTASEEYS